MLAGGPRKRTANERKSRTIRWGLCDFSTNVLLPDRWRTHWYTYYYVTLCSKRSRFLTCDSSAIQQYQCIIITVRLRVASSQRYRRVIFCQRNPIIPHGWADKWVPLYGWLAGWLADVRHGGTRSCDACTPRRRIDTKRNRRRRYEKLKIKLTPCTRNAPCTGISISILESNNIGTAIWHNI